MEALNFNLVHIDHDDHDKYDHHDHRQVFVTIGTAICLVAALANDQHFPVAKLTVREAKVLMLMLI